MVRAHMGKSPRVHRTAFVAGRVKRELSATEIASTLACAERCVEYRLDYMAS